MQIIRIATRKSPLALWQANHVAAQIRETNPNIRTELVTMTTRGDKILDSPLAMVGGKGLFVKELEQGLLANLADIAVHSMKDLPMELPDNLHLAAIMARHDPTDAFVSNRFSELQELPDRARIGTSSLRRQCQLQAKFPNAEIMGLRGNINTRLKKLDDGNYDAIILATAGLERLGYDNRINQRLAIEFCLPAIGQGAIGIECRKDNVAVNEIVTELSDEDTTICVRAERAMNYRLQGGCQVPIAGYAKLLPSNWLVLKGLVGNPDGSDIVRGEISGSINDAENLGVQLADDLLSRGAKRILANFYVSK